MTADGSWIDRYERTTAVSEERAAELAELYLAQRDRWARSVCGVCGREHDGVDAALGWVCLGALLVLVLLGLCAFIGWSA